MKHLAYFPPKARRAKAVRRMHRLWRAALLSTALGGGALGCLASPVDPEPEPQEPEYDITRPVANAYTACHTLQLLSCGAYESIDSCLSLAMDDRNLATTAGCTIEFDSALGCLAQEPLSCGEDGALILPERCDPFQEELDDCLYEQGAQCIFQPRGPALGFATECILACSTFSAECVENGSQIDCYCSHGPHAGDPIVVPTCNNFEDFWRAARIQCL